MCPPARFLPGRRATPPIKHDVYLGTDADAVGKASVTDPLGVLVSQGQSGTTYTPAQPFAYGKSLLLAGG